MLLLAGCSEPTRPVRHIEPPSCITLLMDNAGSFGNARRMFDDSEVSAFVADDLTLYRFRLPEPVSVDSVCMRPVRRRGYSSQYAIHAWANGISCNVNTNTIAVNSDGLRSLDIMVESMGSDMERREFYHDSLPYVIELESTVQHRRIAFAGMDFYRDGRRINDTTDFQMGVADDGNAISCNIEKLYAGRMDGSLLNRTVVYTTADGVCKIRILSSGAVAIVRDGVPYAGQIAEDAQGHRSMALFCGGDGLANPVPAMYINGYQITVPALRVDIHYDGQDSDLLNLRNFPDLFQFEIRYATDNNFTHSKLYPEPICYLRYAPARDLISAARDIVSADGLMIRMYDGYRPRKMQYVMWEVCPNPNFLSPPGKGSIHNRGGAVDLTLATPDGSVLDMGTDYDFCGAEAYTSNTNLPDTVLRNRQLLFDLMRRHRFNMIRTEWWHFSHVAAMQFGLEDFVPDEFVRF